MSAIDWPSPMIALEPIVPTTISVSMSLGEMWPRVPARYHAHQEHHREIDDGRPHRDLPDRQRERENLVHRHPAGMGGPPPCGPSPSGASRALDLVAERALHFALEVLRLALAFLSAPFGTRRRIARLLLGLTGHFVRDALGLVLELTHQFSPVFCCTTDRRSSRQRPR